jgi:hypothetical protein
MFRISLTALALVLVLSASAEAQAIDACVMKNGLLKVVDDESDCGPQESPIVLSEPQNSVETVRVFDGEGRDVGAFMDFQNGVVWRVLLADLGVIALINNSDVPPRHPKIGHPDIIFGLPNCEGPRYVGAFWSNTLFPDLQSGDAWLIGSTTQDRVIPMASILKPNGECEETGSDPRTRIRAGTVPVEEFNQDLGDTFSRPLPLWIGSSSESP